MPRLTARGYPLVLVNGEVVPADEKYSAIQYEKERTRREELMRATRAGEEIDELDYDETKEVELTPEEKEEIGRKAGILKPRGQAWGWGIWNGTSCSGACFRARVPRPRWHSQLSGLLSPSTEPSGAQVERAF